MNPDPQSYDFSRPVDVAVFGGGPAGVCAAVAAARLGARTLLVERYGYLGGMASAAMVNPIYGFNYFDPGRQIVTGIPEELVEQLRRIPGGTLGHRRRAECAACRSPDECPTHGISSLLPFDPEAIKLAAQRLVVESGAAMLFYCLADEAIVRDGRLEGVVASTKTGCRVIRAAVTIDATGDGDVAAAAGAPFAFGRSGDGFVQPQSLMFRIAGVRRGEDRLVFDVDPPVEGVRRFLLFRLPRDGEYVVNSDSGLFGANPLEPRDLTAVHAKALGAAFALTAWMREHVEGGEACCLAATAASLGVRESRRILGEYVLTKEDVLGARKFPDGIARGCFPLDIHAMTERPGDENLLTPLPCGEYYEIPYRCLAPREVEGLLVAGRCISGTHEAHASYRVMATCMAIGQAAGTAAA
ncbi:MAG TPA: FAD-dependent oxidoreductase, partial [Thermoguttaceae bacterium]|nr:FAD-dependent oxidoreductase [Thermoguttaceae bacterium]